MKWQAKMFTAMPEIKQAYPSHRWLFVTQTVRNCDLVDLRATVTAMNKGFERLSKLACFPAIGWIKSVEVTRNSETGQAHPHFHCLMLVDSKYFGGRNYIKQEQWRSLWQRSMRLDYVPVVNVKAVKPKVDKLTGQQDDIGQAIVETLKYSVKESDLVSDENWLVELTTQLKGNAYARLQSTLNESRGDSTPVESLERTWREFKDYSIKNLPEEHYARAYIKNRKIPEQFWDEILFVPQFREFLDKEFPQHSKDEVPNDDRVVLLYTNEKGEITNVAGRALSDTKIRYVTVKVSDEKKLFGLHRLRKQERVYVLEGQFDSYFIENSVASGDSNLGGVAAVFPELDVVLVYDNEPRNRDIVKQIEKSIDSGYNVCLFPESVKGKDVNDMIQNGLTSREIKDIIDANTFSGLGAKLKFTHWKRC